MSEPHPSDRKRLFVNYNVRYCGETAEAFAWAEARNTHLKIFTDFDGGGFNFYICEFETLDSALLFRTDFSVDANKSLWAEDAEGKIHYF